jgi:glycosyltransferase involved in cell wall biosynthesis
MRIALLAYRGTMRTGGLGIYLRDLSRELVQLGHEIDLYVGPPYPDPLPWLRTFALPNQQYWDRRFTKSWAAPLAHGRPFHIFEPLNFYEFAATRFGFLTEPFAFSLRAARALIVELRAGTRYDLIHDVQTLGYGLLWLRALGIPTITTIHHPLTVDRRFSLQRDRSFREKKGTLTFYPVRTQARVARRVDAVITSSEASVREIEQGFGVERAKIHNVANGVELPPPGTPRARPSPPEILFMARARDPHKGFATLLRALALLPAEVRLRVLDDPPSTWDPLQPLISDLKLQERVRFDGKIPRAELELALRTTSVVAVPSLFEGFGLPALEALASGTPLVASRAGALPEVVAIAGAGTLVEPDDPRALAEGLRATLTGWEDQHRRALAARERIEGAFSWPRVAARTADVYARVLAARRTRS